MLQDQARRDQPGLLGGFGLRLDSWSRQCIAAPVRFRRQRCPRYEPMIGVRIRGYLLGFRVFLLENIWTTHKC